MRSSLSLAALACAATALTFVTASSEDASVRMAMRRHHAKAAARSVEENNNTEGASFDKRATYSGQATFYYVNTGNEGACGGMLSPSDFTVALNQPMYGSLNAKSSWCNKKIIISDGKKQTTATIRDACPESAETCHYGSLDMSTGLFNFFNDESVGVFDITWWPAGEDSGSSDDDGGIVGGLLGGGKKHHSNSGSSKSNDDEEKKKKEEEEEEEQKKKAAAAAAASSKEAAARKASKSSASHYSATKAAASRSSASHYSVTKAAASRSSASVASHKSKISKSKASVSSKSHASVVSVSKASVASVASVSASVVYANNHQNLDQVKDIKQNYKKLLQQFVGN